MRVVGPILTQDFYLSELQASTSSKDKGFWSDEKSQNSEQCLKQWSDRRSRWCTACIFAVIDFREALRELLMQTVATCAGRAVESYICDLYGQLHFLTQYFICDLRCNAVYTCIFTFKSWLLSRDFKSIEVFPSNLNSKYVFIFET